MTTNPSHDAVFRLEEIRELADAMSFQRGQGYFRAHMVEKLEPVLERPGFWQARITGTRVYHIEVGRDPDGEIDGTCTCPAFQEMDLWCKHLVAVMLALGGPEAGGADAVGVTPPLRGRWAPMGPSGPPPPSLFQPPERTRPSVQLMRLFEPKEPVDWRHGMETLTVEWTVTLEPSYPHPTLGLTLRVGRPRLYVVHRVLDFLKNVRAGHRDVFTTRFTYEPTRYGFRPEDQEVLEALFAMVDSERLAGRTESYAAASRYGAARDRVLGLAPHAAAVVLDRLQAAGARWRESPRPLQVLDLPMPLEASLSLTANGYVVMVSGLERTVLLPAYGLVEYGDRLFRAPREAMERLEALKRMQGERGSAALHVDLTAAETEAFLSRTLPQLEQVAVVKLRRDVSARLIRTPFAARVYLDREDERLTARIECVYGDLVVDPLSDAVTRAEDDQRLLVRDMERERQVTAVFERADFSYNGRILHLDDPDAVFRFLQEDLTELESLAAVYVTDRVQNFWRPRPLHPRLRLEMDDGGHWLDVAFELDDVDPEAVEALLHALVERRRYHRLTDGTLVDLTGSAFEEVVRAFDELRLTPSELAHGPARVDGLRALGLTDAVSESEALRWSDGLRGWLHQLRHPETLQAAVPEELRGVLRDYQEHGFQWMKMLVRFGFGGILADDMGLGKTLQTIAFLLSERESGPFAEPALVICPASLVYNWEAELLRFAPSLRVTVVSGSPAERARAHEALLASDVVITSYPLVRRDLAHYQGRSFHALILDEAQFIKNHYTKTAEAIRALRSPRRFALTGTPVENSLDDLWSILHAVFPALAGRREIFNREEPSRVARRVRPFLLRRVKRDVLRELPDKIETVATTELTTEQKKVYLAYLARIRAETAAELGRSGFQKSRIKILAGLTRLRQVCCHPSLFLDDYHGGSGKLDQLLDLLEEGLGAQQHILVFSQFTSMLAIIRQALDERGWAYFYLDGRTKSPERLRLADAFNRGERPIFLVSLKAGGTGLNLTGADTVILYDLWWNPAVEQQAADRAHRIGQQHVVQVIRLLARGTLEQRMYELQQQKLHLIEQVVEASDEGLSALTEADVRELLSLEA